MAFAVTHCFVMYVGTALDQQKLVREVSIGPAGEVVLLEGAKEVASKRESTKISNSPLFNQHCALQGGSLWSKYSEMHQRVRSNVTSQRIMVWECDKADHHCGGIGNQFRGISVALYLAMLSDRALFIVSKNPDYSTELLLQPNVGAIDWRPPMQVLPDSCKLHYHHADCYSIADGTPAHGGCGTVDVLKSSQEDCVIIKTNAVPTVFWNNLTETPGKAKLRQSIDPKYLVGCAMNFLFDFSAAYAHLAAQVQLQAQQPHFSIDSLSGVSYVALHMRWGDKVLLGHKGLDGLPEALTAALRCAGDLGKNISNDKHWKIFVSSDSVQARSEIQKLLPSHPEVFLNELSPVHSTLSSSEKTIIPKSFSTNSANPWSYWGDFLLISRGQAYVVRDSGRTSSFSMVASQINFLPFAHQRFFFPRAPSEGCVEVGGLEYPRFFDHIL